MSADATAKPQVENLQAKDTKAFHEKEYEALRREIELDIKETRSLERNALLANAAIFTWLATTGKEFLGHWWLPWLPVVISGLAAFRSFALLSRMMELGDYIAKLECTFGSLGWERERIKHKDEQKHMPTQATTTTRLKAWFRARPFVLTAGIYWAVLIVGGLIVAVAIQSAPIPQPASTTFEHFSTSGTLDVHVDGKAK